MKVLTSKTPPTTKELLDILESEFSDQYTYKLFGLGEEKSIIVRKSTFIGAQISKSVNEITIEGIQPSIPAVLFSFILQLITGFSTSSSRKLEKEIGFFLNQKYN